MSSKKISGTGVVASTDYKSVKWIGKTKSGKSVQITLNDAINLGNTELSFADKDDVVAEVTFTATYTQSDLDEGTSEPWEIQYEEGTAGAANEIILGAGKIYIGENAIGLTRGGGKFSREITFREINADGDRGPVKDRIVIDEVRVSLTVNSLQILTIATDLYTGLTESTVQS